MCGICGSLALTRGGATEPPESSTRVDAMLARLVHRGPDDDGRLDAPGLRAGMRRLAVIDVEGGAQPAASEDGRVRVIFNGEIYNHRELRAELERSGHRFRTRSDTEVLVHLWEEEGERMLDRLNGMFALCLHDAGDGRTMLARDRLGIKPLYWTVQGGRLLFASETAALRACPGVESTLDRDALVAWFHLQYVPGDRTLFREIRKLPPGHRLVVDGSDPDPRPVRWYEPARPAPVDDPGAEIRELVESSVAYRLIADVPVGVFLSGGVDSAIIADVAARAHDGPLASFSVGFEDAGELDELAAARATAARVGTNHHEWRLSPGEIDERLVARIARQREPVADPAILPTEFLAERARERVTVVLTGEGADESFAGYRRYRLQRRYGALGRIPGVGAALRPAAGLAGARGRQALAALAAPDAAARHATWSSTVGPETSVALFGDAAAAWADRAHATFAPYFDGAASELDGQLRADRGEWLPHNLLAKVDLATMAASLEARVPFLDHRVVERAATLTDDLRIRDGVGKWVLRRAFADRLDPAHLGGAKRGFDLPLDRWLRGPLRPRLDGLAKLDALDDAGLDRAGVAGLVAEHDAGVDRGLPLFLLISLGAFLEAET